MANPDQILKTVTWQQLVDLLGSASNHRLTYPDDLDLSATIGLRSDNFTLTDLVQWACAEYPVLIRFHKSEIVDIAYRGKGIAEISNG